LTRYCDFLIIQNGVSRYLAFFNFGVVMRVKLRLCATFRGDQSNRFLDMAIFRIFKMAAVRHLGFVMRVFGQPTKGIWWSLTVCKSLFKSMH